MFSVEDGPPPPASPKFTCHLTIPAVHTPHGGFEETRFTAWARSKKAAEHSAAGAPHSLSHLRTRVHPLHDVSMPFQQWLQNVWRGLGPRGNVDPFVYVNPREGARVHHRQGPVAGSRQPCRTAQQRTKYGSGRDALRGGAWFLDCPPRSGSCSKWTVAESSTCPNTAKEPRVASMSHSCSDGLPNHYGHQTKNMCSHW